MQYAEVAVTVPVGLTKTFHYRVPKDLRGELCKFSRVEVPFSGRMVQGFVLGFSTPPSVSKIKEIKRIIEKEPFLNEELLLTAQWMVQRYLCNIGDALQCIAGSHVGSNKNKKMDKVLVSTITEQELSDLVRAPKQRIALTVALARPGLKRIELAEISGVSVSVIQALINKGYLKEECTESTCESAVISKPLPILTHEQALIVNQFKESFEQGKPAAWLLHGVTGSGKTEVYLRIIDHVIKKNFQAIVLVPEISLTPQMVERFRARFGSQVALLHSALSQGERYAEKTRIRNGQATVVLGARSAIFAPVPRLGLIIIDEEHESSYKQDESPKYHAREVALQRVAINNGMVILGSATPALESYCRARPDGPYRLATLTKRIDQRKLPKVQIIDLRQELVLGNTSIFSTALRAALLKRIENNEKSILFLNRRGFASVVVCRHCGKAIKCPHCDISMTLHSNGVLKCHYCGHGSRVPKVCANCSSGIIRSFGLGTQRVEEEMKRLYPNCKTLRMDADTTVRKGSHQRILDEFIKGDAQVLIGTQMIAKGLDIPTVTLVGVVSADITLHMPDFRSAEKTFQLLTQVAGRAGRGDKPGEVIIQTYDPEHFSISCAQNHDYISFYRKELAIRKALIYPPFSHLIRIMFTGINEVDVITVARFWQEKLVAAKLNLGLDKIEILGPAPAGILKIKDRFRWQLIIKGLVSREVRDISRDVLEQFGLRYKQVAVSIDVDPISL